MNLMKTFYLSSLLFLMSSSFISGGGMSHLTDAGSASYTNENVDTINCNGALTLTKSKVAGLVKVNGSMTAVQSTIGSLKANGSTTLRDSFILGASEINGSVSSYNCEFKGESSINGSLSSDNCQFKKNVSFAAPKATFHSSSLDSITVRASSDGALQVVELKDGCTVKGAVIFEGGNGELILSGKSQVLGKVKGAKITHL